MEPPYGGHALDTSNCKMKKRIRVLASAERGEIPGRRDSGEARFRGGEIPGRRDSGVARFRGGEIPGRREPGQTRSRADDDHVNTRCLVSG
eukprot:gene14040-biopygen3914